MGKRGVATNLCAVFVWVVLAQPPQCRGYSIYAVGWVLVLPADRAHTVPGHVQHIQLAVCQSQGADGPSSLFGGFGIKLPILVSFKSKLRTESMWALDAYMIREENRATP
jgi:hypothetical protein